jgi:hypothetical protein
MTFPSRMSSEMPPTHNGMRAEGSSILDVRMRSAVGLRELTQPSAK